jgi:hypothetical protein
MDPLQKWTANLVDLETLGSVLRVRIAKGLDKRKRHRELNTILLFTLCLEHNEDKRFLIGIQRRGVNTELVQVNQLFDEKFGIDEDADVILIPDLGLEGPRERDFHRIQLVSFVYQAHSDTTALIRFLEEKKLRRAARDDDLFLVVHIEQDISLDYIQLSIALQLRPGGCPYRRIFVFGPIKDAFPPCWFCAQVYPLFINFKELDGDTARVLLGDRRTKCGPAGMHGAAPQVILEM